MKLEIVEKKENPLLKRVELKFRVIHENTSTPKRSEVKTQIATALNTSDDLIVVEKIASLSGKQEASGIARVYESKNRLDEMERKYLLTRGMPKEAEKQPSEEKKEKPAEEKPAEEKAEKQPEKKPTESAEKPAKAEKPKEGS